MLVNSPAQTKSLMTHTQAWPSQAIMQQCESARAPFPRKIARPLPPAIPVDGLFIVINKLSKLEWNFAPSKPQSSQASKYTFSNQTVLNLLQCSSPRFGPAAWRHKKHSFSRCDLCWWQYVVFACVGAYAFRYKRTQELNNHVDGFILGLLLLLLRPLHRCLYHGLLWV